MNIKELLTESFGIFKKNIKTIIGLLLMIYLPVSALNVFADIKLNNIDSINEIVKVLNDRTITEETRELYSAMYSNAMAKYSLYMVVMLVVAVLSTAFLIAIIKMAAHDSYGCSLSKKNLADASVIDYSEIEGVSEGDGSSAKEDPLDDGYGENEVRDTQFYFSEAVKLLPRYAWAIIISAVFVIGGLFLFVFPGIFAAIASLFVVHTVSLTPFKGRVAFAFSRTIVMKRPVVLGIYAIAIVVQAVFSELVFWGSSFIDFGNIYANAASAVVIGCLSQFLVTFLDITVAVAFAYVIRKTPQLVEILEAGKKYEAEKAKAKARS